MKIISRAVSAIIAAAFTFSAWADNTPKYIFYFIGDGMGMGHVLAAQTYNRMVLGNADPLLMMQFPVAGVATTYSASSPVTDSAAAGTALSTGYKTNNGMLGVSPDTAAVTSIAKTLHDAGFGIGIVTSVAPDDATPGAFYAHVPHRSMFYEIGRQAAESGYEFIAGAGLRGTKDKKGNPNDLTDYLRSHGVDIVRGAEAAAASPSRRVLMLNTDSLPDHLNEIGYTIDSITEPGNLNLPLITRTALNHLQRVSPGAFFMMVEGGNIDHAGHGNDGGTAIKEILNFNEAIAVAYEFLQQHPDETLIVITADHDTGGMAVGNAFTGYNAFLHYIDAQRISKDRFAEECRAMLRSRRNYTWDDMRDLLTEKFGFWTVLPLNDRQTESLRQKYEKTFELRNSEDQRTLYNTFNEFTVEVFRVLNDIAGIGWVDTNHTGNYVPVYAAGQGAANFAGIHDNTQLPILILDAALPSDARLAFPE